MSDTLKGYLDRVKKIDVSFLDALSSKEAKNLKKSFDTLTAEFSSDPPKYPPDMVALGPEDLGRAYNDFMAWQGYLRYALTVKEADITLLKGYLNTVRKVLHADLVVGGKKDKEVKEAVDHDETVIALEKLLTETEVEQQYIQAQFYFYETRAKTLSREISRRGLPGGN